MGRADLGHRRGCFAAGEEDRISIDDFAQTCAFYGEQPWWGAQHIKMIGLEAARRSRAQASLKGERTAGEA